MTQISNIRYDVDSESHLEKWAKKINITHAGFVMPPPENNSQETIDELRQLSKITNNATERDVDRALLLDKSLGYDFGRILDKYGLEFPKEEFNRLWGPVGDYIMYYKWLFNRPRPFQLMEHHDIDIRVNTPSSAKTPAYPSGHTAYAVTAKIAIQRAYPVGNLEDELDRAVNNMALSRMILGVHYPSDNATSIGLVPRIIEKLNL